MKNKTQKEGGENKMKKSVIFVFMLALFVLSFTVASEAAVQNIKISGDLTMRGIARNNFDLVGTKQVSVWSADGTGAGAAVAGVPGILTGQPGPNLGGAPWSPQVGQYLIGIPIDQTFLPASGWAPEKDNKSFFATIARIRLDADLTDNVGVTIRLLNERDWGETTKNLPLYTTNNFVTAGANVFNTQYQDNSDEILLDLAYVTLKSFFYEPLTVTVGRQELAFGNKLIIGDPDTNQFCAGNLAMSTGIGALLVNGIPMGITTPFYYPTMSAMDLSARKGFDAVRLNLSYEPWTLDFIFSKIKEQDIAYNDDTNLWGVNAQYDFGILNTIGEVYYFLKDQQSSWVPLLPTINGLGLANASGGTAVAPTILLNTTTIGDNDVHTIGTHIVTQPLKDLTINAELAFQFGDLRFVEPVMGFLYHRHRKAWALQLGADYVFSKVKYTPTLSLWFTHLSGDKNPINISTIIDPRSGGSAFLGAGNPLLPLGSNDIGLDGDYNGWDPMFEDQTIGDIMNAIFPHTNSNSLLLKVGLQPREDIKVNAVYSHVWLAKKLPVNSDIYGPNGVNAFGIGPASVPLAGLYFTGTQTYVLNAGKKQLGQELDLHLTYDYTEDVQFGVDLGWFFPGAVFDGYNDRVASQAIGTMKVTF